MNLRSRKVVRTVQIIFGLYLLFTVVAGFFQLLPPPAFNEAGTAFLMALFATGYMMPVMQIVFLIVGLMFVFNKWSALGAIMLVPFTVNIILFHIFLDMMGWWMALIFVIIHVYLIVIHWPRYKHIFAK